ncbi:MAG: SpoIIE family protein phosphatase [Myxococcales bacterium]|nr:SpoIIE family protein phosphatase [Myxococcales bacterium]
MAIRVLKGMPLSVKLMATTIALLLFTVGLYGAMNLQDLSKVFDASRAEQQLRVLQSVATDAQNVTDALGGTAGVFASGAQYGDLTALLERLRKQDPRLVYARVLEGGDTPVSQAGDAAGARAGLAVGEPPPGVSLEKAEADGTTVSFLYRDGALELIEIARPWQAGDLKGRMVAGWSVADIAARNAEISAKFGERKQQAIVDAVLVGGLIVLLGVVLSVLQSLRISRPIRELTEVVERIAHGDLHERAMVDSGDEIGVLGRNFNYMAERIGVLLEDTKEKATYEKELEVARIIQESLLPGSRVQRFGDFEFMGYFKPASICGGDWWSYAEIADGKLLVLIGDVTGHGVSSAMITAAAKSCCDTLRHVTEGELTVTFLLEELNKTIYEAANRKFVMTFFATIIDPKTRTLTFANAGHNFPMLFRAQPNQGEPTIVPLVTRGNRLGDVMESRFMERTVPYAPGDVVVWYTDGLTEGVDTQGEEYGEKRFRRSIRAALDQGAEGILNRILRDAERWFVDFNRPEDDITLVVGKFGQPPRG